MIFLTMEYVWFRPKTCTLIAMLFMPIWVSPQKKKNKKSKEINVSTLIPDPGKKWLPFGLTSNDLGTWHIEASPNCLIKNKASALSNCIFHYYNYILYKTIQFCFVISLWNDNVLILLLSLLHHLIVTLITLIIWPFRHFHSICWV